MYNERCYDSLINWQCISFRPNYDASGRAIKDAGKEGETATTEEQKKGPSLGEAFNRVPCGLVVRIRRSHRRGRGSIPRMGDPVFFFFSMKFLFLLFFFCLFFPLHLILASSMKPFYTHVLSYTFIYWQVAQRMSQEIKRRREVLLQS